MLVRVFNRIPEQNSTFWISLFLVLLNSIWMKQQLFLLGRSCEGTFSLGQKFVLLLSLICRFSVWKLTTEGSLKVFRSVTCEARRRHHQGQSLHEYYCTLLYRNVVLIYRTIFTCSTALVRRYSLPPRNSLQAHSFNTTFWVFDLLLLNEITHCCFILCSSTSNTINQFISTVGSIKFMSTAQNFKIKFSTEGVRTFITLPS